MQVVTNNTDQVQTGNFDFVMDPANGYTVEQRRQFALRYGHTVTSRLESGREVGTGEVVRLARVATLVGAV
jgi:hypothetical protein